MNTPHLIGKATLRRVKKGGKTTILTIPAQFVELTGIEPGAVFNIFLIDDSCNLILNTNVKPKKNIIKIRRLEKELKNLISSQLETQNPRDKKYFQSRIDEIEAQLEQLKIEEDKNK